MKRNVSHSRKSTQPPLAWREAQYAAVLAKAADRFDDRVSENFFDADDEREQIDLIVQALAHGAH